MEAQKDVGGTQDTEASGVGGHALAPEETFCMPGFVSSCGYSDEYVWCLHVCTCVLRPEEDSGTLLYGSAAFS